jgi:CHAT domain-containing protein
VILSACNTAAGSAASAEALSGLARAFIYAQARALLVSHREVYSDATVKLITVALREMASDPKVGRAEAMRRSMMALIDNGPGTSVRSKASASCQCMHDHRTHVPEATRMSARRHRRAGKSAPARQARAEP